MEKNALKLSLKNISKSFGSSKVLDNISFMVNSYYESNLDEPLLGFNRTNTVVNNPCNASENKCKSHGNVLGILGESGRGKTTLLRIIAGLENADSGSIKLDQVTNNGNGKEEILSSEIDFSHEKANTSAQFKKYPLPVGFSFQEPRMIEHISLLRNISLSLNFKPLSVEEIKHMGKEILSSDEINRKARECSGGMRKKADIIRAIISRKKIILLDEPLSFLDEKSKRAVADFIFDNLKDRILIYSSHEENHLSYFTDSYIRL